jgi:hypothetical protein
MLRTFTLRTLNWHNHRVGSGFLVRGLALFSLVFLNFLSTRGIAARSEILCKDLVLELISNEANHPVAIDKSLNPDDLLAKNTRNGAAVISKGNPLSKLLTEKIKMAFEEYRNLPIYKRIFYEPDVNKPILETFAELGHIDDKSRDFLISVQHQYQRSGSKEKSHLKADFEKQLAKYRKEVQNKKLVIENLLADIHELKHPHQFFLYFKIIQTQVNELVKNTWDLIDGSFVVADTEILLELLNTSISADLIYETMIQSPVFKNQPINRVLLLRLIDSTMPKPFVISDPELFLRTQLPLPPEQLKIYHAWFNKNILIFRKLVANFTDGRNDEYLSFAKFMVANNIAVEHLIPDNPREWRDFTVENLAQFSRYPSRAEDIESIERFVIEIINSKKLTEAGNKAIVEYLLGEVFRQFP